MRLVAELGHRLKDPPARRLGNRSRAVQGIGHGAEGDVRPPGDVEHGRCGHRYSGSNCHSTGSNIRSSKRFDRKLTRRQGGVKPALTGATRLQTRGRFSSVALHRLLEVRARSAACGLSPDVPLATPAPSSSAARTKVTYRSGAAVVRRLEPRLKGVDREAARVGHEPVGARQVAPDADGHHAGRLDRLDTGPGVLDADTILEAHTQA